MKTNTASSMLKKQLNENKGFIVFLVLMFMFRSSFADWSHVPTGSMKPTIIEGDRILVNKMAYDIRIPFTHISLIKRSDPSRGDIIIFDSKVSDKRLVKRVIGLPGDKVEMHNNIVTINDRILNYADTVEFASGYGEHVFDKTEYLLGKPHKVRIRSTGSFNSSFEAVIIPSNKYLVLGDNRDNSADSRVIGFVPRAEIVGRTNSVVMSLNRDQYFVPRKDRFLKAL